MPSYETLDAIADAYVPALGILWLLLVLAALLAREWKAALMRLALGSANLVVAYGLMWLDSMLGAWSAIGLDYSTHAAVAFALVLAAGTIARHLLLPAALSLALYACLMLYQQYHSVADIASTLLVIGPPIAALSSRWSRLASMHPLGMRP